MKRKKGADEIARNMSAIRSTGGKTEALIRSALHRRGLRFRKNYSGIRGKPDIVFPTEQVAVFIDGDYWHGRMVKERGQEYLHTYFDEAQQPYWISKLTRNIERDAEVTLELEEAGWLVYRVWESDARRNVEQTVKEIAAAVRHRRKHQTTSKRKPRG